MIVIHWSKFTLHMSIIDRSGILALFWLLMFLEAHLVLFDNVSNHRILGFYMDARNLAGSWVITIPLGSRYKSDGPFALVSHQAFHSGEYHQLVVGFLNLDPWKSRLRVFVWATLNTGEVWKPVRCWAFSQFPLHTSQNFAICLLSSFHCSVPYVSKPPSQVTSIAVGCWNWRMQSKDGCCCRWRAVQRGEVGCFLWQPLGLTWACVDI